MRDENLDDPGRRTSADAHELVHLVSRFWLPDQPRWIAEGLATYLGDAEFVDASVVHFGRWEWRDTSTLLPLEKLWAWDVDPPARSEEHELYQSAWAWIHYFANHDEARLARLWQALRARKDSTRAIFDGVFPPAEQAALYAKVQRYLAEGRFRGWESRTLRSPKVSAAAPVPDWEVHLLRRSLFARVGVRADLRRESGLAAEVSPSPPAPAVELAVAEDTLAGPERTDVLRRLETLDEALVGLGSAPDLTPAQRFAWLEKASQRQGSARAQLAFARAANAQGDRRALEAATRAVALAPWSIDARVELAVALASNGRCAEGASMLDALASLQQEGSRGFAAFLAGVREQVARACGEVK